MFPLLEDLERCSPGSRHSGYVIQALFGYLVVLLSRVEAASHQGLTVERPLPPLVLKVLDYLYSHYQESQSLDSLAACPKPPSFTTLSGTCTLPPWTSC